MHLSVVVLSQEHNAKNYASKKALQKSKMSSGWTLYTDFPRGTPSECGEAISAFTFPL